MTTAPTFKRIPIALSLTPPPRYPPPKSDHLSLLLLQPRGSAPPAPTRQRWIFVIFRRTMLVGQTKRRLM
jgi:hypothetical protein